MTDTQLRDLFHSVAPSLDGSDPAAVDRAWRDGTRRRVGVRTAVIGSIAACAAAVTGVALVGGPDGRVAPDPSVDSPTSPPTPPVTGPPVAERVGKYAGADVWWAPSATDESSLPPLSVAQLPPVIDLDAAKVESVGEPVVALFSGRGEQAFVLTASQRVVELDISGLDRVADESGNVRSPLSSYSLSSDGLRAFFTRESSLEVLDLLTGEWTTIDTPDWLAEGARWVMPDEIWVPESLGEDSNGTVHQLSGGDTSFAAVDWVRGWTGPDDEPWGPVVFGRGGTARAAFAGLGLGEPHPLRGTGGHLRGPARRAKRARLRSRPGRGGHSRQGLLPAPRPGRPGHAPLLVREH
ncbi:hypothetical protein [Nocardioides sp. B-3]|uniref:hypothetical protein n=1 Tax=Nocardioides sp. B-3 TaxID=2895565 RepID=UPI0021520B7D|nr:hypothetical protein [Nocardioides sp. B-3]UUZ57763.1 hypothetical protein LP418_15200 [Nocardioides sp. B-3]